VPSYPLRALVLRKTKLGEADLIVTMLAADGHQVRAVAKGARKTKSRFGARVEPFSVVDLLLHTGRTLEVIAEVEIVRSHDAVRGDLDRSEAGSVVVDLLDKISVEGQGEPKLFAMALATLDAMEAALPETQPLLVSAFLLKALAMHGYRPSLEECAACAGDVGDAMLFSPRTGGCVCRSCSAEDPSALPMSADERAVMRALLRAKMADVEALGVPDQLRDDVLRIVVGYVGYHVPARMKALDMYARAR
jgi:DNA repair protein RecO (recombination protein O)